MLDPKVQVEMKGNQEEQVQKEKRRKRQAGFTLVELLAVVAILAIVAGVGFTLVGNQLEKSRENADIANVRAIADAVQRYLLDHPDGTISNQDPNDDLIPTGATNANVSALVNAGYLGKVPDDPWGNSGSYLITVNGNNITVTGVNSTHNITLNNVLR